MADITMCLNEDCPLRHECYRFTAPKNPWRQAYSDEFKPNEDGTCNDFWDNKGRIKNENT